MTILDLFSCVGCHALGMERAGHKIAALCEINPWRRNILAAKFPKVKLYEDVQTMPTTKAKVCFGGPPCQGTSVASAIHGYRSGATLWPAMLKQGLAAGAEWFVVEQPPGNAAWETTVNRSLSNAGFHVARFQFSAAEVGTPYIRKRVYILASPSLPRLEIAWKAGPRAIKEVKGTTNARGTWHPNSIPALRMDAWRSERLDERKERIEALGDSNPPAMAEVIGLMLKEAE